MHYPRRSRCSASTKNSCGWPISTARAVRVWFVMLDGAYYIGTGATSAKWRAMQRDARIGWVIDGGPRSGYKGASLRGHAEEVHDATRRARVYEALGRKYFGTLEQAKFIEIFGR